jgi:hypothetical protein
MFNAILAVSYITAADDDVIGTENLDNMVNSGKVIDAAGPVFGVVQTVFVVIGVAILLAAMFKVVKAFAKGDFGSAAKTGIGGIIAAILCLNLTLPITLINGLGSIASNIVESVGSVADTTDGGGTGDSTGGGDTTGGGQ